MSNSYANMYIHKRNNKYYKDNPNTNNNKGINFELLKDWTHSGDSPLPKYISFEHNHKYIDELIKEYTQPRVNEDNLVTSEPFKKENGLVSKFAQVKSVNNSNNESNTKVNDNCVNDVNNNNTYQQYNYQQQQQKLPFKQLNEMKMPLHMPMFPTIPRKQYTHTEPINIVIPTAQSRLFALSQEEINEMNEMRFFVDDSSFNITQQQMNDLYHEGIKLNHSNSSDKNKKKTRYDTLDNVSYFINQNKLKEFKQNLIQRTKNKSALYNNRYNKQQANTQPNKLPPIINKQKRSVQYVAGTLNQYKQKYLNKGGVYYNLNHLPASLGSNEGSKDWYEKHQKTIKRKNYALLLDEQHQKEQQLHPQHSKSRITTLSPIPNKTKPNKPPHISYSPNKNQSKLPQTKEQPYSPRFLSSITPHPSEKLQQQPSNFPSTEDLCFNHQIYKSKADKIKLYLIQSDKM